jgi:hypothetical protein
MTPAVAVDTVARSAAVDSVDPVDLSAAVD